MTRDEALRAVISGEDAAVYAYGVVAARLTGQARGRAIAARDDHRRWRDRWAAIATVAVPAEAAYDLPRDVNDAGSARELAALVELRLVPVYADLASATSQDERDEAARAGAQCAQRSVRWGAAPQAFPSG